MAGDWVDIEKLYQEVALAQHPTYAVSIRARLSFFVHEVERFRRRIRKRPEEIRILDVACGVGKNALPLAHLGYQVYGLDNGRETLACLDRYNSYPNLQTVLFDLEKDDFRALPSGMDVLLLAAILEHLVSP